MTRYRFGDIFQENPDGSLTLLKKIDVNGVIFDPTVARISFGPGLNISGVNFHLFKYLDIAAEEQNGTLVIQGFYK